MCPLIVIAEESDLKNLCGVITAARVALFLFGLIILSLGFSLS